MNKKSFKFNSDRLENFMVLEERRDNIRLFPHTQQLGKLHQAIDQEFRPPLDRCISMAGKYSDDYWKILRGVAVSVFCEFLNSGRPDKLRLCCLLDKDKVARNTIVQQITEHTPRGACHRFKFYGGHDFFEEIYLSGKRLVFSNHALQRFTQRAKNIIVEELSAFIGAFFGARIIGMNVNNGPALVLSNYDELLAFTYIETEHEYFVTTCLSLNEINQLTTQVPAKTFNLHFGETFARPRIRNWNPLAAMFDYESTWKQKKQINPVEVKPHDKNWEDYARKIKDSVKMMRHGSDSRLLFLDNIPGPVWVTATSGQEVPQFDESAFLASRHKETFRQSIIEHPELWSRGAVHYGESDFAELIEQLIAEKNG